MRFLHINEKNAKTEIATIALGDVHLGSKEARIDKLKEKITTIKDNKNARCILMGDLLDLGLKDSVGGGSFDNDMEPEEQISGIIKLLNPIKNKIWCMLGGNHEERLRQRTSIDVNKIIAKELGTTYCGPNVFIKARIGNINYSLFATHGSSGSISAAGKLNTIVKYSRYIDSDVYLMGHVHELLQHTENYFKIDMKDKMIRQHKRHFIITGHYLEYGGYAEQKGYAPGKVGSPTIILSAKKHDVQVEL